MMWQNFNKLTGRFYSSNAIEQLKILDLTRLVAGPICTMILGDLGAKVIKVESPDVGDECREWLPRVNNDNNELTSYFASLNRNKRSISVNFKSKDGIKIMHDLAGKCDVLIENYVPGKLDKLGLGYEQMKVKAPHLIYCSLTGFGNTGPYKYKPGLDLIASSIGGMLHITGPEDGEPCKPGVALIDITTGLYAHGAILAALIHRLKTGKGQRIECNLLSTEVACLINVASNYLNSNVEGKRYGTAHGSVVPYQSFKTSDGYFTIAGINDVHFVSLCKRLNIEELSKDERFLTNPLRVKNRKALLEILNPHFSKRTKAELMKLLEPSSFPHGPVNTIAEVFNDEHIKEIELVKEVKTSRGTSVKVVGPPVVYSELSNVVRLPPPYHGEHTREILSQELNYSTTQIDKLFKDNVVQ